MSTDPYKYTKELLPCPFCGVNEEAPPYMNSHKKKNFYERHYTIACTNCGCEPDYCVETERDAIAVWNKRITLDITNQFLSGFNTAKEEIKNLIDEMKKGQTNPA